MQVLLLAYEWPPITAAQALRWYYLTNGLAQRGVSVHVLCPDITSIPPYAVSNHLGIAEYRVWPGPFIGLAQKLAGAARASDSATQVVVQRTSQSWLMRTYKGARSFLDQLLYPDVRTEWYPFARRRLARLLSEHSFDVIISSHEPGVDLLLGLWAQKHAGVPWVVDMADPLCTPYAPRWRRWLDKWFEGLVLRRADKVILTTDVLREVLMQRHAELSIEKFSTIPQGAPDEVGAATGRAWAWPGKLHIVFTGNFYEAFRNPAEFAMALRLLKHENIALTIAGDNLRFAGLFEGAPNVRFLGRVDHFECLALQAAADVLLNIGNSQSYQIPGKIYEYLVTGKSILHLRGSAQDPTEEVLIGVDSAYVADNVCESISVALKNLFECWKQGRLGMSDASRRKFVDLHGWSARAEVLQRLLMDLMKR
ncbi:MAG: glycosyltransferase [Proteobacteria bacterium]|nr:glycosyltransferase [Pseudomonadota bacterium]